ncbi:MAG TPA: hypothetical protein DIT58_11220, partial [Porticoccaceae bacterium]|nr:hypothetical protein [Porticoccaceae bacterium]
MSGDSPGHKPEAPPGQNPSVEVRRTKTWEVITLLVLGVVVLGLVAGFYVINPAPSPSQYSTFKTLLALAVAGVGALLPGFITLEIGLPKGALRAGGAIALFAIVYFFNPAQLAPAPEQIGGDHITQTVAAGSTAVIHTGSGKLEIGYTIAQHEQALREREQQMRQDLERAHRAETKLERITLENELNAVQEQLQNLHNSYQDRIRLLEEANQQLQALATGLSPEKLQAAKAALAQGDTTLADHLFAEVEALEQTGIERAAAAAYQRGKIAEDRIDYPTAYRHFQRAVQLAPDQLDYVEAAARLAFEMQDLHPAIRW